MKKIFRVFLPLLLASSTAFAAMIFVDRHWPNPKALSLNQSLHQFLKSDTDFFNPQSTDKFSYVIRVKHFSVTRCELFARHQDTGGFRGLDFQLHAPDGSFDDGVRFYFASTFPTSFIDLHYAMNTVTGTFVTYGLTYGGGGNAASVKIYVDGVSVPLTVHSQSLSNNDTHISGIPFQIGKVYPLSSATQLDECDGIVDEAVMFDDELTAAQMWSIHHVGRPIDMTGFAHAVHWWNMQGNDTHSVVHDRIGSEDLTPVNIPDDTSFVTTAP